MVRLYALRFAHKARLPSPPMPTTARKHARVGRPTSAPITNGGKDAGDDDGYDDNDEDDDDDVDKDDDNEDEDEDEDDDDDDD